MTDYTDLLTRLDNKAELNLMLNKEAAEAIRRLVIALESETRIERNLRLGVEATFDMNNEEIGRLKAKVDDLEAELELERMRLGACGVAALGYFEGCCDEYRSASLEDVLRLQAENAALREGFGEPVAWEWKRTHLTGRYTRRVTISQQQAIEWATDSINLHQADTVTPLYARKEKP